jgi:transglutaminase-like putative cysteine protease
MRNRFPIYFGRWMFWLGFFLSFTARAADTNISESKVTVGPPGDWVKPNFFEAPLQNAPMSAGENRRWLLIETEINVPESATFYHRVKQICSYSGVQDGAQISLDFDPDYESLQLHWVRIWRGTNFLNRLDRDKIKIIQQERNLEQHTINGQFSAILVLEDVRVGDVIDYACTFRGDNPVFGGRFAHAIQLQTDEPIGRLRTRLLWPTKKRLFSKNHATSAQPVIIRGKEITEYCWDARRVPELAVEDSLPVWYECQPWVQLSEFQTWDEVNQWALKLFPDGSVPSPELSQKLQAWRRMASPEEQVLAVLRFVQDEVRYFGIEMGEKSHKPAEPSTVYNRRFGDCKDKSFLFVTALRTLGIEAWPVLVNAFERRTLDQWQPSPLAFNHVIAAVRLNGQLYWFDPTINYQRGPLSACYLPDYERGLIIRPKTVGLTVIPNTSAERSLTTVSEYFQVRGRDETADLKVVTVATGRNADILRKEMATIDRDKIEKSFQDFYSRYYPLIKIAQPVQFADDEKQNRVEMTEFYTIEKMWTRSAADKRFWSEFSPHTIASVLYAKPRDKDRTMPLALGFPDHRIFRAEVNLPKAWPADKRNKTISDPAFFFQRQLTVSGRKLVLEAEYHTFADSIPADRVKGYLQQLDEAARASSFSLIWP